MEKKNILIARFIIVTMMIGLFSPNVDIQYKNDKPQITASLFSHAEAREKRLKRKRPHARPPHARPPHHKPRPPHYRPRPHKYYYGSHRHHRHYGHYRGRRILAFAAGLAIGSMIASSSMPTTCTTLIVNGISYRRCDNSYYRPFYNGDMLVYEVVRSPY